MHSGKNWRLTRGDDPDRMRYDRYHYSVMYEKKPLLNSKKWNANRIGLFRAG